MIFLSSSLCWRWEVSLLSFAPAEPLRASLIWSLASFFFMFLLSCPPNWAEVVSGLLVFDGWSHHCPYMHTRSQAIGKSIQYFSCSSNTTTSNATTVKKTKYQVESKLYMSKKATLGCIQSSHWYRDPLNLLKPIFLFLNLFYIVIHVMYAYTYSVSYFIVWVMLFSLAYVDLYWRSCATKKIRIKSRQGEFMNIIISCFVFGWEAKSIFLGYNLPLHMYYYELMDKQFA